MLTLGMVGMWGVSSFLVWAICAIDDGQGNTFRIPFLHALAIGACVAPTDPVLAVTVIKGRFADKHVRPQLAQLISAESGANDGLGYPFLYFALYFIRYVGGNGEHADSAGGASEAMKMFFGETIGFVVLLSVVWGALLGWLARRALKFCDSLSYVDRESFYAFTVLLAILLVGTCGMVGSDDILAGFVAGNALNWDDWFRDRTAQDSFDPTIDTLLNWGVFIFFGAVCPWRWFAPSIHGNWESDVGSLQLWRLVCLAIAVLCLRRLPVVLILYKCGLFKDNVRSLKEALFMGWFGPIGVSSIFYSQAAITYLREDITGPEGELRRDVRQLYYLLQVCVWFVMVSSVVSAFSVAATLMFRVPWRPQLTGLSRSSMASRYSVGR
jgi:NhaP-type Na+/H+ or K+/H+ antiporter